MSETISDGYEVQNSIQREGDTLYIIMILWFISIGFFALELLSIGMVYLCKGCRMCFDRGNDFMSERSYRIDQERHANEL